MEMFQQTDELGANKRSRLTCCRESSSAGRAVMELLFNSRTERFVNLETQRGTVFIFFEVKFKEVPLPYKTLTTDSAI